MATALRFRPLDAFYNVLNPVPFGFFVAALVFDATYFATAEVMWGKSAAWLISLGLLFAILPCVVDLCRVWLLQARGGGCGGQGFLLAEVRRHRPGHLQCLRAQPRRLCGDAGRAMAVDRDGAAAGAGRGALAVSAEEVAHG